MESKETDREKRSRVLLQAVADLTNQGLSTALITYVLKESYNSVKHYQTQAREKELCAKAPKRRATNQVQQEILAVTDLRNRGIDYAHIAALLKISWNITSLRVQEAKKQGALFIPWLKGPFETREERIKCVAFFIRIGMTKKQSAYVLDLDEPVIGNDYVELKMQNKATYRTWEYPLQQIYLTYQTLLGNTNAIDEVPALSGDYAIRFSLVVDDILSKKILSFLIDEGMIPDTLEFPHPYDSICAEVFASEDIQWHRCSVLWREVYDDMWYSIRNATLTLPENLDAFFQYIDDRYREVVERHMSRGNSYYARIDSALASLSPRNRRVLNYYYGIGVGKRVSMKEIAVSEGFSKEAGYQINRKFLHALRHPKDPLPTGIDNLPVTILGVSSKIVEKMRTRNIITLGNFREKTIEDLCTIPYIGIQMAKDIASKLQRYGITLAE